MYKILYLPTAEEATSIRFCSREEAECHILFEMITYHREHFYEVVEVEDGK